MEFPAVVAFLPLSTRPALSGQLLKAQGFKFVTVSNFRLIEALDISGLCVLSKENKLIRNGAGRGARKQTAEVKFLASN